MLDTVFRGGIAVLLAAKVYFLVTVWGVYHSQHRLKPSHVEDLPLFSEIWWLPIVTAFAIASFRVLVTRSVRPFFFLVCKDKEDKKAFETRVFKASTATFKLIWYSSMSVWAYLLLKDTRIWPEFLGGSGTLENSFENFPFAP
jgi:hypothetical protein